MSTTLQYLIPADAPRLLGEQLARAGAGVKPQVFARSAGPDFDGLGLMDRGQRLADALARHLPAHFPDAAALLVASMGQPLGLDAKGEPLASGDVPSSFFYLPHSLFVATQGLGHLDAAMAAQHALTQRFTAEFSLRPYLQHHTQATLVHLAAWSTDASAHVRRAVSESTRPRLPWAPRLRVFDDNPEPVLALLTRLRDDPSSYVRRSVANHLNDRVKSHPDRLLSLAREWLDGPAVPSTREALVRHALRTALKRGDPQALALFGHGKPSVILVAKPHVQPAQVLIGERVELCCELHNPTDRVASVLADWRVHYVKADGSRSPKVFKGQELTLAPGARVDLQKTLSLRQMTTRTHHPGRHRVEIALNGQPHAVGHFDLR
ncbi:MAG TPA: DNA alkylation repair protein [Hydrogenophaga sp.]|uniref:DNA alkylation repair protein n=1 Tax=Hydrogenophaga sp. TaxID=1904254 RepID=UPI002B6A6295|nr:DNA alkylation repair protein [Hydrogenophaga sp.]HMN94166.1 DNA alkylation repair protein [Hydrogenophaga sp.]